MNKILQVIFIVCIITQSLYVDAQNINIESFTKKDKLKLNSGLNANLVYNSQQQNGMPSVSYFLNGTVNLSIWDLNMPLTVNYSNRKFSYSQPFSYNFVTLRPTYKWVSAEIGTCYTTFSPYSLNGHQYQGIGLALSPKKWSVNLMYGRLLKAQNGDSTTKVLASYKRMGMGIKTVYKSNKINLGLTLFNAADQKNSLLPILVSQPQPKENLVIGLEFGATLFKRLQFSTEYHSSALNDDKDQLNTEMSKPTSIASAFLNRKSNIQSYNSYKGSLITNISQINSTIGLNYQRVDPNYTTLGGYYFVNDFQNITINYSQAIFNNKINFAGNIGFQEDNLSRQKSSSQSRVVGSINLGANPSEKLNINLNFSNFRSYSYIRTAFDEIRKLNPFEQLDTLNYQQINQNISTSINYIFSSTAEQQKSLNLDLSVMESVNKQGGVVRIGQQSGFINANMIYNNQLLKKGQGFSLGLNTSINTMDIQKSYSLGPLFNWQQGFMKKKLMANSSISYIYSYDSQTDANSSALNIRGNLNYNIDKNKGLVSNLGLTNVSGSETISKNFITLTVGFTSRF